MLLITLSVLVVGGLGLKNVTTTRKTRIDVVLVILSPPGFGKLVYGLSNLNAESGGIGSVAGWLPTAPGPPVCSSRAPAAFLCGAVISLFAIPAAFFIRRAAAAPRGRGSSAVPRVARHRRSGAARAQRDQGRRAGPAESGVPARLPMTFTEY